MNSRPEDFGTMNCGYGITIIKPFDRYEVAMDGVLHGSFETLWEAMQQANILRGGVGAE